MKQLIKKLTKHPFLTNTTLVFLGTNLGNFLNLLFHLVLTRLLDSDTYGLFQSLTALTAYQGIFLQTFSLYIIFRINQSPSTSLTKLFHKITLLISLSSLFITLVSYPLLTGFLHLTHPLPYLLFSLIPFLIPLPLLYQSLFRAHLKFLPFTLISLLASFLKLSLSTLALITHPSLNSLLFAVIISLSLTAFIARTYFKKTTLRPSTPTSSNNSLSFLALALFSQLSLISLYTTDTLLVRHFFSPTQTGLYSAAVTLGKIVFFLTTPLLTVTFPFFTKDKPNQKHRHLIQSLLLTIVFSILTFTVIKTYPQPITKLLLGRPFTTASSLLPLTSLYMLTLVILNLFTQYLLSQKKLSAALIPTLAATLQITFISLDHPNLLAIIHHSLTAVLIALTLSLYPLLNPFLKKYAKIYL